MKRFPFQGKGLQKTYWLDGRKGLSLPLLSNQIDDNIPTIDLSHPMNIICTGSNVF